MPGQCFSGRDLQGCGEYEGFYKRVCGELSLGKRAGPGYYVSRIYDSGIRGTEWNWLVLDVGADLTVHCHVWLFDERSEGERADGKNTAKEKYEYLKACAQYHSDYREQLLYGEAGGRGRFARIGLEVLQGSQCRDTVFRSYCLSFPRESFTRYLPELYRGNRQLERFLAVQQSIYLALEQNIDSLGDRLDYVNCWKGQLRRLAEWMGWGGLADQLEKSTLLELLKTGVSLSGRKGTCDYYTELARILTGRETVIVEEPEHCRATVLVLEKPLNGREKRLDWLRRNVPIGVDVRFVILDKTDRLDGLFFLDRTAVLSEYESELAAGGVSADGIVLQ